MIFLVSVRNNLVSVSVISYEAHILRCSSHTRATLDHLMSSRKNGLLCELWLTCELRRTPTLAEQRNINEIWTWNEMNLMYLMNWMNRIEMGEYVIENFQIGDCELRVKMCAKVCLNDVARGPPLQCSSFT